MHKSIQPLIERMKDEDWTGREQDLLNLVRKHLADAEYKAFENSLMQGYAEQGWNGPHTTPTATYLHWCQAFNKVRILAYNQLIFINWSVRDVAAEPLTPDQVERLEALGWRGSSDSVEEIHKFNPPCPIEPTIVQAMQVLDRPFSHWSYLLGSPPKTRYERLMCDDIFSSAV